MKLDPFYPIFDSSAWIKRLVPLGIRQVQLRIKTENLGLIREEIATSMELCQKYDCRLFINDYWHLAIELGCKYVHLGQEDLQDADLSAIAKAGMMLGISTHSEQELERALASKPSYIALGPIYPTILKKMPWMPQGLKRIPEWKSRLNKIPLIAIGGLNPQRGVAALKHGADCVSVVTDITLNSDPEQRIQTWLKATEPFRKHSLAEI